MNPLSALAHDLSGFSIPGMRRRLVLVVDDEPEIRAALQAAIERNDLARVLTAADAEEAKAILRREKVDLLVSDQQMPGGNGVDLLRSVRREHPGVTRVLMTAHAEDQIAIQTIVDAGLDDFLPKPFRLDEAIRVVRAGLEKTRVAI